MLYRRQLNGILLPDKALCLTFDDGPGPSSIKIAEYLFSKNISATFFMIGKHMELYSDIVSGIKACGHTIGNHTYSHQMALPEMFASGFDIENDIATTTNLVQHYNSDKVFFRAPWGEWNFDVADFLNEKLAGTDNYIGPYHWDIDGDDWKYWEYDQSVEECAENYSNKIKVKGRGIILMHDSSADLAHSRENNQTYELIKILVPELIELGYNFVNLNSIPLNFRN